MESNSQPSVSGEEHLLLIRFSAMGDVAMLAPVVRILTQTYPQLKVTILTREFFTPIFKDISGVSVFPADLKGKHKGIFGLRRLASELKNLGITSVGDMHNVLRSNLLRTFFLFFGINFRQINKGRAEKKALTATKNKVFQPLKSTHQRYADVLSELGYPVDLSKLSFPEKSALSPGVNKITGEKTDAWIGIAPFAAHQAKAYPMELLTKVLHKLSLSPDLSIFLFGGGPDETEKLQFLASGFENIFSLAGKLKFEEELEVISNLDLMVSMDSGNAHLAAMYGVKVLTIWGVTHPYAGFGAYNQPKDHHLIPDRNKYPAIPTSVYGNKFPKGYEKAIETITPDKVVAKIRSMISSEGKNKKGQN